MRYVAVSETFGKPGELIDARQFPDLNWKRALSLNMIRQATAEELKPKRTRRRKPKAKEGEGGVG